MVSRARISTSGRAQSALRQLPLQFFDAIEQLQRKRRARPIDAQVTLQPHHGANPPHAADVELPVAGPLPVRRFVRGVQNAFADQGDDLFGLDGAVPA
jgi:hypothetical protein